MDKGLVFYKLISPYKEDVTKNCKLTVNEIDSNFLTLKDADIKEIKLSEDEKSIILVRNDGEEYSTPLPPIPPLPPLPNFVRNLSVNWDKEEGKLTFSWDNDEHNEYVADGFLTDETGLLQEVSHDGTLQGNGTIENPMGISLTEVTGTYAPVKNIIDITGGGMLPEHPTVGDRYLTYEWVSDYGYLYNFDSVKEIIDNLSEQSSEWRVPSKKDWDKLLNSIEPCDYQNHDEDVCHVFLGKYAGIKLKSKDKWKEYTIEPYIDEEGLEHNPLQPGGLDEFGFRVLPAGNGNEEGDAEFFTEKASFWTTTHIKTPSHQEESGDPSQDIYVKMFDYRKTGVLQEAECPDKYYSLRLLKNYNGHNFKETETINGRPYKTVLFRDINQIWLSVNFAHPTEGGKIIPNRGEEIDEKKGYFINVYNGVAWEKKGLNHGDSIVVTDGVDYENEEYRVYVDENGNQILITVETDIYNHIIEIVTRMIAEEAQIREDADTQLQANIDAESQTRENADNVLTEAIDAEAQTREATDTQLQENIDAEAQTREAADTQLQANIDTESQTREAADDVLTDSINAEVQTREAADIQLQANIDTEAQTRGEADNVLTEAIDAEAQTREAADDALTEEISTEKRIREEADTQLQENIDTEAQTRGAADTQLQENIDTEAQTREAADTQLQANIDTESQTREAADTQLQGNIDAEAQTREETDEKLLAQIIDNPNDSSNPDTPDEYVIKSNGVNKPNLTFYSKGGTNNIDVFVDGNYGDF